MLGKNTVSSITNYNVFQAKPLRADFSRNAQKHILGGEFQSKMAIIELFQVIDLEGREEFPIEPAVLKPQIPSSFDINTQFNTLKRIFS